MGVSSTDEQPKRNGPMKKHKRKKRSTVKNAENTSFFIKESFVTVPMSFGGTTFGDIATRILFLNLKCVVAVRKHAGTSQKLWFYSRPNIQHFKTKHHNDKFKLLLRFRFLSSNRSSEASARNEITQKTECFRSALVLCLFDLSFTGDFEAFPTIEWDSDDGLDSVSSIRSMDTVNSLLGDDPTGYLGKRRRRDERGASNSRLVRSKKIKSDLASLPFTMPMTRRP